MLHTLADPGVVFLLFRVGLEVRSQELIRVGRVATVVACLGVAAPFLLGWWIMALAGSSRVESFFVAASMVATSVGITARVLASVGVLQDRASQTILAAAVIDDVLGLTVLAVVSLAREHVRILELAATAIGFTLVGAASDFAPAQRPGALQLRHAAAVRALLAATYAGIAAIVGAFLAGLALADTVDERVRNLTDGVSELLMPFFLAGIGCNSTSACSPGSPL